MRITEVVAKEAVYDNMLWFEESMRFFMKAPEPLAQKVETMLENDDTETAKKIIAEFLGISAEVNNEGAQLSENPVSIANLKQTISDKYTDPQTRKVAQKKLGQLTKDVKAAGNDKKFANRAVLAKKKFGSSDKGDTGGVRPRTKGKTYNVETATAGGTSAGNIASLPIGEIPKDQKAWAGSPGKIGKSPKPVTAKKQKPTDNAINKNANLFSGEPIKRQ